jgi:hypothetical protein
MRFAAVLDSAYGQGPLQVGTSSTIFTCAVPPVRNDWVKLENPILTETLIGRGPLAQNSTINVNSDVFFRTTDGLGSMIFGRRDFLTWGNVPISNEMNRTLAQDDRALLSVASAVTFDNRFFHTASPKASSRGTYHPALLDLNFDPLSSLRGKAPSIWESLWTGINTLQIINGIFGTTDRCFIFTFNQAQETIELYELIPELLPGVTGNTYDNSNIPITWEFESAALFNASVKPREQLVSLRDGEFGVSNVVGTVRIAAYYRPDENACWVPWHSFSICAGAGRPQYFPRLGLGEPTASRCIASINTPARDAYTFQVKFVVQGTCTFTYARFMAVTMPTPKFKQPICADNEPVCVSEDCSNPADGTTDGTFYSLQASSLTYLGFTLPNPIFGGGSGPTPDFSTFVSMKGCLSQVSRMVPKEATPEQLNSIMFTVVSAVTAQQAICDEPVAP